jgi:GT2 family glycosyltransferase
MSVSVIIPYHSAPLYLSLCLASLEKDRDIISEIIIVSNGANSAPDLARNDGTLIKILEYKESIGYAAAVNRGAEKACSSFLLFCDTDTFFPQAGWIKKHLNLQQSKPTIGITSTKLLNYRTDRILDFGIGRTRFNNFHPCRDALLSDPRVQKSRRVQMACSAAMMIRKDLFLRVGGFDETLRYHYQDIDLCLRLKGENQEVWVVADAIAYHRGSSSTIVRSPFQIDERGYFTAKNAALLDIDYEDYLTEALEPYLPYLIHKGPFGVVNLSTFIDPNEVLDIVANYTALELLARWTPASRDIESIILPDVAGIPVLRYKGPLLILVDRFLSLRFNALWQTARDTSTDLVVDRHANVFLFNEVIG